MGLYSLRARFYNPSWGRFLSQDTWAVNYSHPIELNRYGYAAGNPVNLSDPSGNYSLAEYAALLGGGAALGAAGGALTALACGGDVGTGIISGAVMGLGFTALSLAIGPQASLVLGMGASAISMTHASADMRLNGLTPCNGMQLTLAIAGLWLGAQNFHSEPPSIGVTPGGEAVITSGQSLVVVGNTVTTLEQLLSILSLYMAIEEGDGENGGSDSSSKAQRYLRQLPNSGDRIEVQPGEIDFKTLAILQGDSRTGDEFLLFKSSDGKTYLFRGGMTVKYPPDTAEVIAHSHPYSRWHASRYDYEVLDRLEQDSSFFVTESGFVRQFFRGGTPEKPLESEGYYIDLR